MAGFRVREGKWTVAGRLSAKDGRSNRVSVVSVVGLAFFLLRGVPRVGTTIRMNVGRCATLVKSLRSSGGLFGQGTGAE